MISGKVKIIVELFSLLSVGLAIYALTRRNILFLSILNYNYYSGFTPCNIVSNYVPDILWGLACIRVAHFILLSKYNKAYYVVCIMLPILLECLQYCFYALGTFDIIDLFIYFFIIFSYLILSKHEIYFN